MKIGSVQASMEASPSIMGVSFSPSNGIAEKKTSAGPLSNKNSVGVDAGDADFLALGISWGYNPPEN